MHSGACGRRRSEPALQPDKSRVRSNPQTEGIPIIVITGKDMTPDDKLFISNEIADVIRKGDLMMSDLETRLRQTLEEIGVKPNEWQKY